MLTKDKWVLHNFDEAVQHEWLETNGLGGWSASSIIGVNTRRYHGLLVAAVVPPTDRTALVSKLDEAILTSNKRIELGTNWYEGHAINPNGHYTLQQFTKDLFPEWHYEAEGIQLRKTIAMVHGENTVLIIYNVDKAPAPFTLELLPLIAGRGYHSINRENDKIHWSVDFSDGIFHNQPDGETDIFINVPGSTYQHNPLWFRNFYYAVEEYRGLEHTEDLLNHGRLYTQLKEGDSLGIIISTDNVYGRDAQELFEKERIRRQALIDRQQLTDNTIRQLTLAADQFIVRRNIPVLSTDEIEEGATIIAGYHWFTDWGRDTMISLPGLCLNTGRFEDARKIIAAFAQSVSRGMLPNRFQDNGAPPEYNNVDGTLWFFIAVYKYLQATDNHLFILREILPVLKNIIDWHFKGTRYNIHAEEDGLLYAGQKGVQLTWMDAKIGDWVVTPRMGKPVEIQALWYNALKIFAELLKMNDQYHDASLVEISAEKVKQSFIQQFWHIDGNYLMDVIDENGRADTSIRPNQLFAISLPFALIEMEQAKAVLKIVEEQLYTPVGLRSLPQSDKNYVHAYGGDAYHRDAGYHQGTVWSWLLGPYVDALIRCGEREKAKQVIDNFIYHLSEGCIGTVAEIFDADTPHHPRGCVAQAWGVAEILRVMKEYRLYTINADIFAEEMESAVV